MLERVAADCVDELLRDARISKVDPTISTTTPPASSPPSLATRIIVPVQQTSLAADDAVADNDDDGIANDAPTPQNPPNPLFTYTYSRRHDWPISMTAPKEALVTKHCDPSPLPEGTLSTSVLNFYHYFNAPGTEADALLPENCVEHTDPGLLTVLARGTQPGLELELRDGNTATPCCSRNIPYHTPGSAAAPDLPAAAKGAVLAGSSGGGGGGDDEAASSEEADGDGTERQWLLLEPIMEANQVVVLVGETLARATGGKHPAGLHRVIRPPGVNTPRFNMAFELRPLVGVFHSLVPSEEQATA